VIKAKIEKVIILCICTDSEAIYKTCTSVYVLHMKTVFQFSVFVLQPKF